MRAEIAAMTRSLADLAPRNAVVALEGAIADLVQRVEMMRQNGHVESCWPRSTRRPQNFERRSGRTTRKTIAAGLEREIRAIGGKIDGLASTAINPETFERIRRQTEEVRDLIASAASRAAPLERLERQIGELADRVERLGASPAPHFESAEMAALLDEARRQIERSTPAAALMSIERRLEQIAAKLDQEIARPARPPRSIPGPSTIWRGASTGCVSRWRRDRKRRSTRRRSKSSCAISTRSSTPQASRMTRRETSYRCLLEISDKLDRLPDARGRRTMARNGAQRVWARGSTPSPAGRPWAHRDAAALAPGQSRCERRAGCRSAGHRASRRGSGATLARASAAANSTPMRSPSRSTDQRSDRRADGESRPADESDPLVTELLDRLRELCAVRLTPTRLPGRSRISRIVSMR